MTSEQKLTLINIILAIVIIVVVILIKGIMLSKRKFICSYCNKEFYPKWYQVMFETHFFDYFKIKCPHCGKKKYHKIENGKI